MPRLLPTGSATIGDASFTGDGSYVLANYPFDANLDWVLLLRSALNVNELKYKDFTLRVQELKRNRETWAKIENGIGQAAIIIVDPKPHIPRIQEYFRLMGKPIPEISNDRKFLDRHCAIEIIGESPIAHLLTELGKSANSQRDHLFAEPLISPRSNVSTRHNVRNFAPDAILDALGGSLRHTMVLSARAHAMFDVYSVTSGHRSVREIFNSPTRLVTLTEIMKTPREFDEELPISVQIMNDASEVIAQELNDETEFRVEMSSEPLVKEINSATSDHAQAADIAIGWARDLIALGDIQSVARRFRVVTFNGRIIT